MSDKYYIGRRTDGMERYQEFLPISKVIARNGTDTGFTAGDDTGRTLEFTSPWASQAMAESVLASVKGYVYRPFEAQNALLDLSAMPGDTVTVDGMYSLIGNRDIQYSGLSPVTISAPEDEELDHEYPYVSQTRREEDRLIQGAYSLIRKTAESILLEVGGIGEQVSKIEQYIDSITLSVSNGDTSSTISLKAGEAVISSQNITFSGFVTFTGLSSGTTTIDGACIKTGTIDAERLNLTGAITFSDLNESTQNKIDTAGSSAFQAINLANSALNTANQANRIAESAQSSVDAWTYEGTTYIDGTQLMTGTVTASALKGGTLSILDSSGSVAAYFYPTGASSFPGRKLQIDSGALSISASSGAVYLESSNDAFLTLGGEYRLASFGCAIGAATDGGWACGTGANRWSQVWAVNGTIQTSDRNQKYEIEYGLERFAPIFDFLKPCSYRLIGDNHDRVHMGLIAQDVEQAMAEVGIDSMDFSTLVIDQGRYAIRYTELIPLLILEVQKLKQEVAQWKRS